ncbi:MAG TPA: TMEM43 family protein [Sphingomicrobium sp.]|nr:TMEM43 family protein [Sphingomicrobium sp.]
MIENKRKAEAILTWILRGVGTLVMFLGFAVFLTPLSTMAAVIPLLGGVVRGAVGLVALAVAVPLSILVIAFAWLAYRPILGIALILLAIAVGYGLWRWRKARAPAEAPAAPAQAG